MFKIIDVLIEYTMNYIEINIVTISVQTNFIYSYMIVIIGT